MRVLVCAVRAHHDRNRAGEQGAHRDDARRQELHVVAAAGAGEGRPEPEPERQQEQDRLAERADSCGRASGNTASIAAAGMKTALTG
ncbi:MAG: hypothetical protein WCB44_11825, partial [Stellaceae bacterium]